MPEVSASTHQVRAKLVLIGPAGAGKEEILRCLAGQQGGGALHHQRVGETDVYRASWVWSGVPQAGWTLNLSAYTTAGVVDFNAITEMLLDGVDGIIFVAPVDPTQAEQIRVSLQHLAFNLKRYDRELADLPITLHYHRAERMPGFDPVTLDQFLGLAEGVVPRFVTRSEGDDLSCSFASVLKQVLERIELPSKEEVTTQQD